MLRAEFVAGFQFYEDQFLNRQEAVARIVVRASVEGREFAALLDTGATECVLAWDVAQVLSDLYQYGEPHDRALGGSVYRGRRFPVSLTFPADEGESAAVETVAWTCESFFGPNLIGYGGLLEKLRLALDPAENRFYFGL